MLIRGDKHRKVLGNGDLRRQTL